MERRPHVGTLGEKPLHAALKRWYAEPGDLVEQPVDGFVVDLVRGGLLIEVQTRSFSSMKRKLATLLDAGHAVRIVHPVALERTIVKLGEGGEVLSRRRSPRRGAIEDVFAELVYLSDLLPAPRLTLDVVLTREDELRAHEPGRAWRRKGWVVQERHLVEVVEHVPFPSVATLAGLLPHDLPDDFSTAHLAEAIDRPRRLAQQMTYCLRHAGLLEISGKDGNALLHRRVR